MIEAMQEILSSPSLESEKPDRKKRPTRFKTFLKFLNFVGKEVSENLPLEKQTPFFNFKNLVTDLNRCAISGSSILEYRLDVDINPGDIDLFIENTSENKKIINNFFNNGDYKPIFTEFKKIYLSEIPDSIWAFPNGYYYLTSSGEYGFKKHSYKISTSRFIFDESGGFSLNFIFVEFEDTFKNFREDDITLYNDQFIHSIDKDSKRYWVFNRMGINFSDIDKKTEKFKLNQNLLEIYPRTVPINFIYNTFDILELRYIYSFELQQPITVYAAADILLSKFEVELSKIDDNLSSMEFERRIKSAKRRLSDKNENFLLKTSKKNTLTLSEQIIGRGTLENLLGFNNQINDGRVRAEEAFSNIGQETLNRLIDKCYTTQNILAKRIEKYMAKGFTFQDPYYILENIAYFISLHASYISTNPQILKIILESAISSGKSKNIRKAKTIKQWNGSTKEFITESQLFNKGMGEIKNVKKEF